MSSDAPLLLALHSSSETLGVGVQTLPQDGLPAGEPRLAAFPLGRRLSNALLPCLEELLPADQWPRLARLMVATGPGGFTGTRLTVVLARTLAQQLAIPLHGFSSFLLIARRLAGPQGPLAAADPASVFWLHQDLPRRGTVAGAYGLD
ncbi:MAG: tRNA (adenosine(37)-N6)-threonylcarbamoyltransferase complex dimerization subunit type 1 TsaB, partial [Vulcanococcus sp.]